MKNNSLIITIIASVALILTAAVFGSRIAQIKKPAKAVKVTGICERTFESDLIVWKARFSAQNMDLQSGFSQLKEDREQVLKFLEGKGIAKDMIDLSSISVEKMFDSRYNNNNYYNVFTGYKLTQTVKIESNDVDKIEKISKDVTELINNDVMIESEMPKYYYTKLDDLKIEMLENASADAYERASVIAQGSRSKIDRLTQSQMGVFQIVGYNSDEDYSWGGTFNTSSRKKTASITVKSTFTLK
ncbi:hypothetical protein HR11_07595 [Porphyromonas macacae]|uniref:Oxidative stress defense protein n=1 Tax=Porphyromonas macacae TaxID=28115 RepID=A0A0A2G9Y0_9PORP|nr:SIMPL domain-containing protein [Porphyromonas macacae]KGN72918.1 hypothetical protein HQ47_08625 [Porphyromonas macacae]KGO00052.1 hypothetical protein HR11_07595 [Porphyromonas macacae]SUB89375.1 oxidative stress defense protein [Porphyromonas macacae]